MKIGVVGGGISGLACANVLSKCGNDVVVFEASDSIGGQWTETYPQVELQNTGAQYRFHNQDYPGGLSENEHPTAAKIVKYIDQSSGTFDVDIRTGHKVTSLVHTSVGWKLEGIHKNETGEEVTLTEEFDKIVIATGQLLERKKPEDHGFTNFEDFKGTVLTGRDVTPETLSKAAENNVAVIGFGKTSLDMCSMVARMQKNNADQKVHHVFRGARWFLQKHILGLHITHALFPRFSTTAMPSWGHPTRPGHFINTNGFMKKAIVDVQWIMIQLVVIIQLWLSAILYNGLLSFGGIKRVSKLVPDYPLVRGLRPSLPLAPDDYVGRVGKGDIIPQGTDSFAFYSDGLILEGDKKLKVDTVILCTGSPVVKFPFFSDELMEQLNLENNNTKNLQLYRHLIHPSIPNLAFAGFNHSVMHMPGVEIGALWTDAFFRGTMKVPSNEKIMECMDRIRLWKQENIIDDAAHTICVNTRFHQYLDTLLFDLDISCYRKSNIILEVFQRYEMKEYDGVIDEYLAHPRTKVYSAVEVDM